MTDTFKLSLQPNTVAIAYMQGLDADDMYLVEFLTTPPTCPNGDDGVYVPFSPNGCQWIMSAAFNPQRFDTPGEYRFVPQGAVNTNVAFDYKTYPQ